MIITIYHIVGTIATIITAYIALSVYITNKLKKSWKADILKSQEINNNLIKAYIKEKINDENDAIEKEMTRTNTSIDEIKELLKNQQETLISIQLGVTELKPRITNLESRVDKIEERINKS